MATKKAASKVASKAAAKTSTVKSAAKKSPAKSAAKKAETTPMPKPHPSHEEISRLAEEKWRERGHPEGSPHIDWHAAEDELKS